MTQVMAPAVEMDVAKLHAALNERVDGEVRFDPGTLSAYAQDASNYRQVPIGVVVPRTVDAGAEAVAVCRETGAPVLSRGGGTSLAGQCVNTAIVIDWTKYWASTPTPNCSRPAASRSTCSTAGAAGWPATSASRRATTTSPSPARSTGCGPQSGTRPETAVLADGFSCRTQIQAGHLGRDGIHLAQLLAGLITNER